MCALRSGAHSGGLCGGPTGGFGAVRSGQRMSVQGRGRVETRALEATAGFPDV